MEKKKIIKNIIIIAITLILILIVFVIKKVNNENKINNQEKIESNIVNQVGGGENQANNSKNEVYTGTNQIENNIEETKSNYTLYNFGYEGCYYCTVMEPIFKKYKNSYDNITFKDVDIYEDTALTNKYGVQYTPTFIIVDSNGKQIDKIVGAVSEEKFKQFVEKYK